ncbi:MAG: 2'-5' RNA ligase family protein [Cypionkella sp.]
MRLFLALVPPPSTRALLLQRMEGLVFARWQSEAQLHVTLRFIGEADRHEAEALMLAPLAAARGLPLAVFAGAVVQTANATKAATAKLLAAQARMLALPEIPSDFADDKWWE